MSVIFAPLMYYDLTIYLIQDALASFILLAIGGILIFKIIVRIIEALPG